MLRMTVDKVCYVVDLAMQRAAKVPPLDAAGGIAGDGDDPRAPILGHAGDPTDALLEEFLDGLGGDEQADLLALAWIGSDTFDADDWEEACDRADEEVGRGDAVRALLESPQLAEYLIDGLQALGYECPEDDTASGAA